MPYYVDLGGGRLGLLDDAMSRNPVIVNGTPAEAQQRGIKPVPQFGGHAPTDEIALPPPNVGGHAPSDENPAGTIPLPPPPTPVGPSARGVPFAEQKKMAEEQASSGTAEVERAALPPQAAAAQPAQQGPSYAVIPGTRGSPGTRTDAWRPTTRSSQGTEVDPDQLQAWKQQALAAGMSKAEVSMSMAETYSRIANEKKQAFAAYGNQADQQRAAINDRLSEFERERAQLSTMKVDVRHKWVDQRSFGQLIAGIGAVLTTAGGGMARQDFRPGEAWRQTIDREMQAQQMNIEARQRGLQLKEGILEKYMRNNDPRVAQEMARISLNDSLEAELQGVKNREGAKAIVDDIAADTAARELELTKRAFGQSEQFVPKGTGAGGGTGPLIIPTSGPLKDAAVAMGYMDPSGQVLDPAGLAKAMPGLRQQVGSATIKASSKGPKETTELHGYTFKNPRFAMRAIALSGSEAATATLSKEYEKALKDYASINPLTEPKKFEEARLRGASVRVALTEARSKVDMGPTSLGAEAKPTLDMMDKVEKELGPNPFKEPNKEIASRFNPRQEPLSKRALNVLQVFNKTSAMVAENKYKEWSKAGANISASGDQALTAEELHEER